MFPGALKAVITQALTKHEQRDVAIIEVSRTGGGCINEAACIRVSSGNSYFLKWKFSAPSSFFFREMEGLQALRSCNALHVPEPIQASDGDASTPAWLLMEDVTDRSNPRPTLSSREFSEKLGRGLACIHQQSAARYGFAHDNFIGLTPQPNPWCDSWIEFYREHRIGYMTQQLSNQGKLCRDKVLLMEKFLSKLDQLLAGADEQPALLHGDLWGGNVMADGHGAPTLIDPAVYYGHREADLAMTELFGGFDRRFYEAYNEAFPLAEGYRERRDVYNLYHILNHALLFGRSYWHQAESIIRRYVK